MPRHLSWFVPAILVVGSLTAPAGPPTAQAPLEMPLGAVPLPAANYVKNGGFEQGLEGWQYFQHKAGGLEQRVLHNGSASFRMGGRDESHYVYLNQHDVPLEAGRTYTLSAWVKATGVSSWGKDHLSSGAIFLTNYGWTQSVTLVPPGPTFDWVRLTRTFVAMPTRPRADGKPSYTLTVFWPPKSDGQFWLDDIQIEEGSQAADFCGMYVGDGLVARERLAGLTAHLAATRSALEKFDRGPLVASLASRVAAISAEAASVHADLLRFRALPAAVREALAARVDQLETRLADARTAVWTGPAHIPLSEIQLPAGVPEAIAIRETCLKGEHRDIALNIANLTLEGYPARVAASALEDRAHAERIAPGRWISLYSVPAMRGFSKPGQIFTDALPQLDEGQIVHVEPAGLSQVIVSLDSSQLLPGEYRGTITFTSLVDKAGKTEIPVQLSVLPRTILPLAKIDVAECFGHADYAWEPMIRLGVNTFDIEAAWIDSEFAEDGRLESVDFTRIDPGIQKALAEVPDARFLCLSGQGLCSRLQERNSWKGNDPRVEVAFKSWVKALADHLRSVGVQPARLVMETYDEPGEGDYAAGAAMARWIHEVDPVIRTQYYVTGIVQSEPWKQNALAHDVVAPAVQACTPASMAWVKTLGKTLWTYDCAADGESFHPIAYYRLMPWTCRAYGITGWGHFSWFNSSHGFGRGYRPWEGVETQNLVYPGPGGEGYVLSRRYLAIRAGHEDYQVLDALERAMADRTADPKRVVSARKFLEGIYQRALSLAPRAVGYQTHIAKNVAPDLVDQLRREAVAMTASLLPPSSEIEANLTAAAGNTNLGVKSPGPGKVTVRFLVDGRLPWQVRQRVVSGGYCEIGLSEAGEVNRCAVQWVGPSGEVALALPIPIPRVTVDSTFPGYSSFPLNDGLRIESVKFEENAAWISGPGRGEHWVQLDFDGPRRVEQMNLYWMTFTGLPLKTRIEYVDSAGCWKAVSATPDFRPALKPVEKIEFAPVTTSRLRVLMAPGGGGKGGPTLMGLSEVEVR